MKNLLKIIGAGLFVVTMAACTKNNSSEWEIEISQLIRVEETRNGSITSTEYEWRQDFAPAGERRTTGGFVVYEDKDYTYSDGTAVCLRYDYSLGLPRLTQKRVTEYRPSEWSEWGQIRSLDIYELDASGNPVEPALESEQTSYDSYGRITRYTKKTNGETVLEYMDYKYNTDATEFTIYDYTTSPATKTVSTTTYLSAVSNSIDKIVITNADGEPIETTEYTYSYYSYSGYKKYRRIGLDDVLVEEQTDYTVSGDTISFETVWYESDGETVSEKVSTKRTYDTRTVIVKY